MTTGTGGTRWPLHSPLCAGSGQSLASSPLHGGSSKPGLEQNWALIKSLKPGSSWPGQLAFETSRGQLPAPPSPRHFWGGNSLPPHFQKLSQPSATRQSCDRVKSPSTKPNIQQDTCKPHQKPLSRPKPPRPGGQSWKTLLEGFLGSSSPPPEGTRRVRKGDLSLSHVGAHARSKSNKKILVRENLAPGIQLSRASYRHQRNEIMGAHKQEIPGG